MAVEKFYEIGIKIKDDAAEVFVNSKGDLAIMIGEDALIEVEAHLEEVVNIISNNLLNGFDKYAKEKGSIYD